MAKRLTPNGFPKPLGKLAFLNLPVGNAKKGKSFYQALVGTDFAQSLWEREHYHAPVSRGVQLHISQPYFDGQTVIAQFAVEDLKAAQAALEKLGGKVVQRVFDVKLDTRAREALINTWRNFYGTEPGESMGKGILMTDPWGNIIGLVQLEEWAEKSFRFGHISDTEFAIHDVAMKHGKSFEK